MSGCRIYDRFGFRLRVVGCHGAFGRGVRIQVVVVLLLLLLLVAVAPGSNKKGQRGRYRIESSCDII